MNALSDVHRKLDCFEDALYKKILEPLAFCAMLLASLSLAFQVLYRFVIIHLVYFPFPYTDEFMRYMLVLTTYLIIPVIMKEGLHPSIDLLRNALPKSGKTVLYFIIKAIILFCLIVFLYNLVLVIQKNVNYRSPVLRVPGAIVYSVPFMGSALMVFQLIIEVLGILSGNKRPFEYPSQEEEPDISEEDLL